MFYSISVISGLNFQLINKIFSYKILLENMNEKFLGINIFGRNDWIFWDNELGLKIWNSTLRYEWRKLKFRHYVKVEPEAKPRAPYHAVVGLDPSSCVPYTIFLDARWKVRLYYSKSKLALVV